MRSSGTRNGRTRTVVVLAVIMALSVLASAATALAWDDCPKGLVNDPYPGACSRYVDTNNDGICDRSQPAPITAAPTTAAAPATTVASATPTSATPTSTASAASPSAAGATSIGGGGDDRTAAGAASAAIGLTTPPSGNSGSGGSGSAAGGADTSTVTPPPSHTTEAAPTVEYNLSPIAIAFLLVYLVSFILYRTRRIRVTTHRKIWNVLLLLTFLLTGVLGMLLVARLNWGLRFNLPFDMLFWHVETGIVMSFISFFHIGWHLKYYRNLLRRKHEYRQTAAQPRPMAAAGGRSTRDGRRVRGHVTPMPSVPFKGDAE